MPSAVSPQSAQQFLQALEKDCQLAIQLKSLLKEEKALLEQRQYVAHQALVQRKTEFLIQLENADTHRKQSMVQMGFSTDKNGFDQFVQYVPASWKDKFQSSWESLSDVMNTCARLNKINGKILVHAQHSMERLMSVIKGTTQQASVYQANGRRSNSELPRMLATA